MKTFTLTQATKQHNPNVLHDAFIAAAIPPQYVEPSLTETKFLFDDAVTDQAINAVVTAHIFVAPPVPVDLRAKWLAYKNAVNNATTLPQLKAAITDDLGPLLKELLQTRVGGLS